MYSLLVYFCCFSLYLDKFSVSVPESVCEISSKSLCKTPNHYSLTVTFIILVLSTINYIFWPVKLAYSLHFSSLPLTAITFSIEPCICSLSVELVVFEITFVVFEKFDSSVVLKEKILIIS